LEFQLPQVGKIEELMPKSASGEMAGNFTIGKFQ
jgi:hypothetical protein